MTKVRAAFVAEQVLGHVTLYENLRRHVAEYPTVEPTWIPIHQRLHGPGRLLPVWRSNWSVQASWRARRALKSALAMHPLDALFFHTQVTALFSVPLMERIPAVISLDATPLNYDSIGEHYGHRAAGGGRLDRQKYALNCRAFQAAAALVTSSRWAQRSLVHDYGVPPRRIQVLPPGPAPEFFALGRRRTADTAAPADRPVRVLFVGGDFARKGGPLLLECFSQALADRCELHLVTGADVLRGPNVYVHRGLRPNSPELCALYAQADVFVLPSLADCFPNALLEAAAAGLPIVTTTVGALGEAVLDGESGRLVPPGDGASLHHALASLVDDPARRARMGQASYALARGRFDSRRNGRALLDLIVRVAEAAGDKRRTA